MIKELFKPAPLSARASAGLLAVRFVAGLAFLLHGWSKIQHPFSWMGPDSGTPAFFQGLAALSEFGGGLAWVLGLLTPLASFGIACTMAVAIHLHMVVLKQPFVPSPTDKGAYELPALYLTLAVLFVLAGPGRYAADRFVFGQRAV